MHSSRDIHHRYARRNQAIGLIHCNNLQASITWQQVVTAAAAETAEAAVSCALYSSSEPELPTLH
jgi:hypothetical protein